MTYMKPHSWLKTEVNGGASFTMWAASTQRINCCHRCIKS